MAVFIYILQYIFNSSLTATDLNEEIQCRVFIQVNFDEIIYRLQC